MGTDNVTLARAAYAAYAASDRTALDRLIAPDFRFTSPLDNRLDRKTYFGRCWPNHAFIDQFEFIHLVPYGARVFVTYEARTGDGNRFRNTEILTVKDGGIVEDEVYFGWTLPHQAPPGGFVDDARDGKQGRKR